MTTRNVADQHVSGVLNDLAFATLRAPSPEVVALVLAKVAAHLWFAASYAFRFKHNRSEFDLAIHEQYGPTAFVRPTLTGIALFTSKLSKLSSQRHPVSRDSYHRYRSRSRGKQAPYALRDTGGLSVSITTHNRREDLAATLQELSKLTPPPDEIIVCLDGSTDGSAELIEQNWPSVHVITNPKRIGSIPSRDRIISAAENDLALLLDDDSFPIEADFIRSVKQIFDVNPTLGVITFPQRSDETPQSLTQQSFGPTRTIYTYQDSGSVIRRDLYHALGGYPHFFEHAYEEPDMAVRCFEFGVLPIFIPRLTIRHRYTSVERNERRTHHLHASNEALSVILRAPWPLLVPVLMWRVLNQLNYAIHRGLAWAIREPVWWIRFLSKASHAAKQRQPLTVAAYLKWLSVGRHPDKPSLRQPHSFASSPESKVGKSCVNGAPKQTSVIPPADCTKA
ncbi:MAG: glycosyltransferase [Verrucomicrobiales bacterium]|nr:glycosyltransferase [Verrucomicrobiales bacterium]